MNNATITEVLPTLTLATLTHRSIETERLFAPGSPMARRELNSGRTPDELWDLSYPNSARALSLYNEAFNENERRKADAQSTPYDPEQDRNAQHAAIVAMRAREAESAERERELRRTITRLQNEQVAADDPRLSDFWKRAHAAADNAGHCSVFDQLCEEVGGPPRTRNYQFALAVEMTVYVQMSGSDSGAAEEDITDAEVDEAIREHIRNQSVDYRVIDIEQLDD